MPEVELLAAPELKRGRRFDWLYDQMTKSGKLKSLLSESVDRQSSPDHLGSRSFSPCTPAHPALMGFLVFGKKGTRNGKALGFRSRRSSNLSSNPTDCARFQMRGTFVRS
jgi:hypothetical protein